MIWVCSYVASVVLVNALFMVWPGNLAGAFIVGSTLILRDLAQRAVGHRVLFATLLAAGITALMSPGLAIASGAAFLVSELADWAVFSRWPGSFRARAVASSVVGSPLDSGVFMVAAGFFSWPGFAVMTVSKLAALALLACRRARSDGGDRG